VVAKIKMVEGKEEALRWEPQKICRRAWIGAKYVSGLVSVITPTHNCSRFLVQAMDSVWLQTYRPIEIIVVDDGSTDNTREVLEEWRNNTCQDKSFAVRSFHQMQKGAPAARNKGLLESQGEYIQYLDADDMLSPGKIASQVAILSRSDVKKVAAYGPWHHFSISKRHILVYKPHHGSNGRGWLKDWLSGWFTPNHSLLWTRSDLMELGPWDESLTADDDGEYAMRYLAFGGQLIFCPEAWVYYRQNPNLVLFGDSISGQCTGSSIRSRIRITRRMEQFLAESGLLDSEYRHALSHRYYEIAKNYTRGNHALRRLCLQDFRRLSRDGHVPGTSRHRMLVRLLGFVLTQKLRFLTLSVLRIPTQFPTVSVRTLDELRTLDRPVSQEPMGSHMSRTDCSGTVRKEVVCRPH